MAWFTANSVKVDIDNSQMCNMIDRVPKEWFFTCKCKKYHTRYYICNPARLLMCWSYLKLYYYHHFLRLCILHICHLTIVDVNFNWISCILETDDPSRRIIRRMHIRLGINTIQTNYVKIPQKLVLVSGLLHSFKLFRKLCIKRHS